MYETASTEMKSVAVVDDETGIPQQQQPSNNNNTSSSSSSIGSEDAVVDDKTALMSDSAPQRKLTIIGLMGITYFLVAGGPFGLEVVVKTCPVPFYMLTCFVIFPILWSVPMTLVCAELSTAIPENGGIMAWVRKAFGQFLAFQVGFSVAVTCVLDICLYPLVCASYANEIYKAAVFSANAADETGLAFWILWLMGCAMVVLLTLVNLTGVEIVGIVSVLFMILVMSPFVLFPILAFRQLDWLIWFRGIQTWPLTKEHSGIDWSFFLALLLWNNSGWCVFYTNFTFLHRVSVGYLANETKNPKRTYPVAMYITMILTTVTYTLPLLMTMAINTNYREWDVGTFGTISYHVGGIAFMAWMSFAAMICNAGLFNGSLLTSSRSMYAMAELKMLPSFLLYKPAWYTKPVPFVPTIMSSCIVCVLILLPLETILGAQVIINSINIILMYLAFVVLRYKKPDMPRPYRVPVSKVWLCALGVVLPILISIWSIIYADFIAQIITIVCVAVGLVYYPIQMYLVPKLFAKKNTEAQKDTKLQIESPATPVMEVIVDDEPSTSPVALVDSPTTVQVENNEDEMAENP